MIPKCDAPSTKFTFPREIFDEGYLSMRRETQNSRDILVSDDRVRKLLPTEMSLKVLPLQSHFIHYWYIEIEIDMHIIWEGPGFFLCSISFELELRQCGTRCQTKWWFFSRVKWQKCCLALFTLVPATIGICYVKCFVSYQIDHVPTLSKAGDIGHNPGAQPYNDKGRAGVLQRKSKSFSRATSTKQLSLFQSRMSVAVRRKEFMTF